MCHVHLAHIPDDQLDPLVDHSILAMHPLLTSQIIPQHLLLLHPKSCNYNIILHTPDYGSLSQPNPPQRPHLDALPAIHLRPNIQIEIHLPLPLIRPSGIEINHILHQLPAPVNHPVMPIKRRLVPQQRLNPRAGGHPLFNSSKTMQPRSGRASGRGGVRRLPGLDLGPGALVDGVVDGHHGLHVRDLGVGEALAAHGVEEHLFGRVDPVAGGLVEAGVALVVGWRRGGGVRRGGAGGGAGGGGPRDGGDGAGCVEVAVWVCRVGGSGWLVVLGLLGLRGGGCGRGEPGPG